jgi:serine/threonine protein kinase
MASPDLAPASPIPPNFRALLANPDVKLQLPHGFDAEKEAQHLEALYAQVPAFRSYTFLSFIYAGGSGMQFRVQPGDGGAEQAMKIARAHFFTPQTDADGPFSPVSQTELRALELFGHPNLVRLFKVIEDKKSTIALCTTLVRDGLEIDKCLTRAAGSSYSTRVRQSDPALPEIDLRASFLIAKFTEIASALAHMHEHGVYHFDVKPANILVSEENEAILTDMGSCVFFGATDAPREITTRITWAYAHPTIQNISKSHAGSIEGGGLRTKAAVIADSTIAKFDLYALAKTIQECLAGVSYDLGQRCFASYPFRFLHLVACLLLDGHNRLDEGVREDNGHYFADDIALGYPKELFNAKKLSTANDLVRTLRRFGHHKGWTADIPELDFWVASTINTGIGRPVPYTKRVEAIMVHPAMFRLRDEVQLGWVRDVFPGAENNRWSHTLGVFGRMVSIYDALLSDPELPTALVLLDSSDVEVALVAALLHDAGQTSFGHDFESVLPKLQHEKILLRLLDDTKWTPTLRATISEFWPRVALDRVLGVLSLSRNTSPTPADGIAKDCISGPIDADKQDYLERDSIGCGVPYGKGIDHDRLLRSLTVAVKGQSTLSLAYKAKGRSSFEGILFARYLMYTAIYWHHAFRSIQAMFIHAAKAAVCTEQGKSIIQSSEFPKVYYQRVVCGLPWEEASAELPALLGLIKKGRCSQSKVRAERAIDLLWLISDSGNRQLIERMATRRLHKRIFEINLGDVGTRVDDTYSQIKEALADSQHTEKAKALEDLLVTYLLDQAAKASPNTANVVCLRESVLALSQSGLPLIILDIPTRGVPREKNIPVAIGDSFRKYFKIAKQCHLSPGVKTFEAVQALQQGMACFRVFATPELHEYLVQFLDPESIATAVATILPEVVPLM